MQADRARLDEVEGRASRLSIAPPVRPRPGRRSIEVVLLGVLSALACADFAWPMQRPLSSFLLAAQSLLSVPWAVFLLRGGAARNLGTQGLEVWAFRLSMLALGGIVLSARWWLWFESGDGARDFFVGSWRSYGVALLLIQGVGTLGQGLGFSRFVTLVSVHPARLIVLSFGAVGVIGGLLLSLPVSLLRVHELSIVDNLFMAFSAVCVTGLSVNNLASTYTWFGQGVLCVLVQVGGLGIMVLSAAIAALMGQRLRVKSSAVLAEVVDADSIADLRRVIAGIFVSTFLIEGVMALVFYWRFSASAALPINPGGPGAGTTAEVVWAAVFHAVSGFCNAGFSSFEAGLVPYVGDPVVMGGVTSLIVLGGIGFPVIHELAARAARSGIRRRSERMSLHARVSLSATALLLSGMTIAYLVLEWRGAFAPLRWYERLLAALFQSASCRTAGFNVVDLGVMQPATLMLTCVAMFVGACPGSCAGGIKTTTVAVLFAGLRSELRSRPAHLLDRALPPATIRKAVGVVFVSSGMLSLALFLLLLVEPHAPLELAFEAFSAFSTTGLSTGVTPKLSTAGKVLVLLTMYVGRIGPLTLALAISGRSEAPPVQLPSERVLIG
jgi:trk system potassium uptake protein